MKNIFKYLVLGGLSVLALNVNAQTVKKEVKVSGNCGQCKKKIEKAAKLDGVTSAVWDKKTKMLDLAYDSKKVTSDKIEQSVANAGYDTEHFTAPAKAYDALDECCQYDGKKK